MPLTCSPIAERLGTLADLRDVQGANRYRVRAYRKAARIVAGLPRSVVEMLSDGENLSTLRGIGNDLGDRFGSTLTIIKLQGRG